MYLPQERTISLDNLESLSLHSALKTLEYGNFEERWAIAKVLVRYGDDVIEPLKEVILDEGGDSEHRWFALRILSQLQNPRIVLIITQLLMMTEDEDLISLATQTLASQGENAIAVLSPLLHSPESRLSATRALAQIPHPSVITPLMSVVDDDNVDIRQSAIASLTHFDNQKINHILEKALNDYNSSIRKEALIGLTLKNKHYSSSQLINLICPLLEDVDLTVCQQAAISLSRLEDNLATDILFDTLIQKYTPIPLQSSIVKALAWQETHYSIYALAKALYLLSEEIVCDIIASFSRINKPQIKQQIIDITIKFYHNHNLAKNSEKITQNLCYTWQKIRAKESQKILLEIINTGAEKSKIYAQSALLQLNKTT